MSRRKADALIRAGVRKELPQRLEEYLLFCRTSGDAESKKGNGRLPNLAGFCRFLHCGISDMLRLCEVDRLLFEQILATLEDELLNHSPSPTLLNAYMKKRLGYGEELARGGVETECGQMRLVFEHDVEVDGA